MTKTQHQAALKASISVNAEWVSADLAAQLFGCSKRTLASWHNAGLISFSKPNGNSGKVFYNVQSINRFIQKNKVL